MQIETWRITGSGFHFGRQGLGQEVTAESISSDSLFAALVARLAESVSADELESFLAPFQAGDPPFVLTSAFPFAGPVRFYPAPKGMPAGQEKGNGIPTKELKRVQYISEGLFREILAGTTLPTLYPTAEKLQGNQILISAAEKTSLPGTLHTPDGKVWAFERRPRVALGRPVQTANIFFTGRVVYEKGCGLWFGVRWLGEHTSLRQLFNALLQELGDAGLGGERSSGFGACQIQPWDMIELPEGSNKRWVSLSRYLPREDETQAFYDPQAAYSLDHVGGWLDSPVKRGQRRRAVNLISPGSILGPVERTTPGQMVDVRPRYPADPDPLGHGVYRSGIAISVGLEVGKP